MSTNYYVVGGGCPNACEHCGEAGRHHLGTSGGGWVFLFRADPEWPHEEAFDRWLTRAYAGQIIDEYGHEHTLGDLMDKIYARTHLRRHEVPDTFISGGHLFTARDFH